MVLRTSFYSWQMRGTIILSFSEPATTGCFRDRGCYLHSLVASGQARAARHTVLDR